ncbi:uncharacterized protein LOC128159406 [Crassostrea angulata]|uniref:uncharacterized protein LOC128159406 n=1 Tax=Magallana angulata TaxID=2784310 RepID=UPI0022B117FB|nr:uncharacterized protein LOC128159406 [Crassostrea angulata]
MISLCVWILLVKEAFGSISIKVEPLVVKIGKSDIDVRCIVDGTTLKRIFSMQLIRSNKVIVIIKKPEVTWVDTALGNTTGVKINASISNNTSSYLHLKISKTVVRYPEDMGSYQCSVYAEGKGFVTSFSKTVNLTGLHETTIATRDFTTSFSTEQLVTEGTFKSNITEGTFESNVTNGTLDHDISKVLETYRAIMISIGSFISCIFAFVIIREIRLYRSASN